MFSDAFKQLRKSLKMNQTAIADVLGVSQAAIASWEGGKRQPDLETLARIADTFNVSTDYLLGRAPMDVVIKHETPPPQGDDELTLQFPLDDAPQDESELEAMILRILQQELDKRGV